MKRAIKPVHILCTSLEGENAQKREKLTKGKGNAKKHYFSIRMVFF